MSLIDLEVAKDHLRVTHSDEDNVIQRMLDDAEGIVLDYVTDVGSPAWDVDTVPVGVRAAILEVTTNLYRNRGDEGDKNGPLTDRAMSMLRPHRDPPLA